MRILPLCSEIMYCDAQKGVMGVILAAQCPATTEGIKDGYIDRKTLDVAESMGVESIGIPIYAFEVTNN